MLLYSVPSLVRGIVDGAVRLLQLSNYNLFDAPLGRKVCWHCCDV
jgi:hypothetical protein